MTPTLVTRSPWPLIAFEAVRAALRNRPRRTDTPRAEPLHELDARTLRDIGVDASEVTSIEAEARGDADVTRLRIVAEWHHV